MSKNNSFAITTIDDIMTIGKIMAESGFFRESRDMSKAVVKIMAGRELGFGPFASMNGIQIVMGNPVIGANLCGAIVKKHPRYDYRIVEISNTICKIEFFEVDNNGNKESIGFSEFTIEDAKKANLLKKDNWQKYPRNMLFARAISNGIKWHCPSVFLGTSVYTPDELGLDVDEYGNAVDVNFSVVKDDNLEKIDMKNVDEIPYGNAESKKRLAKMYSEDGKDSEWIASELGVPLVLVNGWLK